MLQRLIDAVETVRRHQEGDTLLDTRTLRKLRNEIELALSTLFPAQQDLSYRIATALCGPALPPLQPQWWKNPQKGWQLVEPSTEEQVLSLLLADQHEEYLPPVADDVLGSLWLSRWQQDGSSVFLDAWSYPLFCVLAVTRSLVAGLYQIRLRDESRLVTILETLQSWFPEVTAETWQALAAAAREGDVSVARLFTLLATAEVWKVVDWLLVLYVDKLPALGQDSVVNHPSPGWDERHPQFLRRVFLLTQTLGGYRRLLRVLRRGEGQVRHWVREAKRRYQVHGKEQHDG